MVKVLLSLPFSSCVKLCDEQKVKLILTQGKRLKISDAELCEIISLCRPQQRLNNGLALLFEYSKSIDHISLEMKALVVDWISLNEYLRSQDFIMCNVLLIKVSLHVLRVVQLLCLWRRMQYFPRPIFTHIGMEAFSIDAFFQNIGDQFVQWMTSNSVHFREMSSCVPQSLLAVLFALSSAGKDPSSFALSNGDHNNEQSDNIALLLTMLTDVLAMETRVAQEWKALTQFNLLIPALRLPYSSSIFSMDSQQLEWFLSNALQEKLVKYSDIFVSQIAILEQQVCSLDLLAHALSKSKLSQSVVEQFSESTFGLFKATKSALILSEVFPLIFQITNDFPLTCRRSDLNTNAAFVERMRRITLSSSGESVSQHTPHSARAYFSRESSHRSARSKSHSSEPELLAMESPADQPESSNIRSVSEDMGYYQLTEEDVAQFSPSRIISEEVNRSTATTSPLSLVTPTPSDRYSFTSQQNNSSDEILRANSTNTTTRHRSRIHSADYFSPTRLQLDSNGVPLRNTLFSHSPLTPNTTFDRRSSTASRSNVVSARVRASSESMSSAVYHLMGGKDLGVSLLQLAFEKIELLGLDPYTTAAQKIAVWFRMLIPRVKLQRRIGGRQCITEVINSLIDSTMRLANLRLRQRRELMRQGAAVKIQRTFKRWLYIEREHQYWQREEQRHKRMIELLSAWKYIVLTSVRLWKWIKRVIIRRDGADSKRCPRLRRVLERYAALVNLRVRAQSKEVWVENTSEQSVRLMRWRGLERALFVIRQVVKRYLARKRSERAKYLTMMSQRICFFLLRCIAIRKRKANNKIFVAATKIQKFMRGCRIRRRVFMIVSSGMRLNSFCRKRLAYRSLKSQLRRVDRPLTIQIHGVRNIPERSINSGLLRVKVSVWWHPLLHIVTKDDFLTIIQSKRPQFMFETCGFRAVEQEDLPPEEVSRPLSAASRLQAAQLQLQSQSSNHRMSSVANGVSASTTPSAAMPQLMLLQQLHSQKQQSGGINNAQSSLLITDRRPRAQLPPLIATSRGSRGSTAATNSTVSTTVGAHSPQRESTIIPLRPVRSVSSQPSNDENDPITTSARDELDSDKSMPNTAIVNDNSNNTMSQPSPGKQNNSPMRRFFDSFQVQPSSTTLNSTTTTSTPSNVNANNDQSTNDLLKRPSFTKNDGNNRDKRVTGFESLGLDNVKNLTGKLLFGVTPLKGQSSVSSDGGSNNNASNKPVRYTCNMEDISVHVPGCHGNSVIKFDLLDDEQKLGSVVFCMAKESGLLYWGGDYQRELQIVQQNRTVFIGGERVAKRRHQQITESSTGNGITLDFRMIAGVALRSRCQWARILVHGKGPLKRIVQSQDLLSNLTIFDQWRRYFLSLDEFGLSLFENKFSTKPFYLIPVSEFKSIKTDSSTTVRSLSKNIVEDITSLVLYTNSGDEIAMRYPDVGSRMAWTEAFNNVLAHTKKQSVSVSSGSWMNKLGEFTTSFTRALSPLKRVRESNREDDRDDDNDDNNNNNGNNDNNNNFKEEGGFLSAFIRNRRNSAVQSNRSINSQNNKYDKKKSDSSSDSSDSDDSSEDDEEIAPLALPSHLNNTILNNVRNNTRSLFRR